MTLDELRQLDPKDIGNWPLPVQLGSLVIIISLVLGLGYWQVWSGQLDDLEVGRTDEAKLKEVAAATGFGAPARMKRAFERALGLGPRDVRLLFGNG